MSKRYRQEASEQFWHYYGSQRWLGSKMVEVYPYDIESELFNCSLHLLILHLCPGLSSEVFICLYHRKMSIKIQNYPSAFKQRGGAPCYTCPLHLAGAHTA